MKEDIKNMVREALAELREELVGRTDDRDLASPEETYVKLQSLVSRHGEPTPDGKTMRFRNPIGDIVAVSLEKDGGIYDLLAIDSDGTKRRLDANSLLDPNGAAELRAFVSELSLQEERQ